MKIETNMEKFAKELHDILRYVEKKSMHNLVVTSPDNISEGAALPIIHNVAQIKDPRFPHMDAVAAVRCVWNDGNMKYKITSRLIENSRFRTHSPEYHTKKTGEWEKAAKILLDVAKPYEFSEVMKYNIGEVNSCITAWRDELSRKVRAHIGYGSNMDLHDLMREIKNMLVNGLTPTTETFRKIVTESYPHYEEFTRRRNMKFMCYHVYSLDDGRVAVSSDKTSPVSTTLYTSTEAIPEPVISKYALLKMLGDKDKFIPEVGVKISPREFYVLDPIPA